MFNLLIIIAGVILMVKVADIEERSGLLWGGITLLTCLGSGALIPLPFLDIVIGIVISFLLMTAAKVIQKN